MFLADALDSGGFAHEQLSQFLTTFRRHNRQVASHNLWRHLHCMDASPCSLKGWVASLHGAHKKARVLQAPAQVVF